MSFKQVITFCVAFLTYGWFRYDDLTQPLEVTLPSPEVNVIVSQIPLTPFTIEPTKNFDELATKSQLVIFDQAITKKKFAFYATKKSRTVTPELWKFDTPLVEGKITEHIQEFGYQPAKIDVILAVLQKIDDVTNEGVEIIDLYDEIANPISGGPYALVFQSYHGKNITRLYPLDSKLSEHFWIVVIPNSDSTIE